jgi:hypothetical protein
MPHIFNTASRRGFGCLKTRTLTSWKISSFDALTTQCIPPIPANIARKKVPPCFDWSVNHITVPLERRSNQGAAAGRPVFSPWWDPRGSVYRFEFQTFISASFCFPIEDRWLGGPIVFKRISINDVIHTVVKERSAKTRNRAVIS